MALRGVGVRSGIAHAVRWLRSALAAAGLSGVLACQPAGPGVRVAVPAAGGATAYTLTQGEGDVLLSWLEREDAGYVLAYSAWQPEHRWTAPRSVARGDDLFVNWADRPSALALADGGVAGHWLVNPPGRRQGDYGYGLQVAFSGDRGETWATRLRRGATRPSPSEYTGFLSFLESGDRLFAAYLSPPQIGDPPLDSSLEHRMTLRVARFGGEGDLEVEDLLDTSVCSCCPLDLADTEAGPVIVYRDRLPGEVRDISIVRWEGDAWSVPASVHDDGWELDGCPTNGPAVDASGRHVVVAWFTAARGSPEVRVAFSESSGRDFGTATRISEGRAVGYVDIRWIGPGEAVVSWVEAREGGAAVLRLRRVGLDGSRGVPLDLVETRGGRQDGMPMLARVEDGLVVVWRAADELHSALLPLDRLR